MVQCSVPGCSAVACGARRPRLDSNASTPIASSLSVKTPLRGGHPHWSCSRAASTKTVVDGVSAPAPCFVSKQSKFQCLRRRQERTLLAARAVPERGPPGVPFDLKLLLLVGVPCTVLLLPALPEQPLLLLLPVVLLFTPGSREILLTIGKEVGVLATGAARSYRTSRASSRQQQQEQGWGQDGGRGSGWNCQKAQQRPVDPRTYHAPPQAQAWAASPPQQQQQQQDARGGPPPPAGWWQQQQQQPLVGQQPPGVWAPGQEEEAPPRADQPPPPAAPDAWPRTTVVVLDAEWWPAEPGSDNSTTTTTVVDDFPRPIDAAATPQPGSAPGASAGDGTGADATASSSSSAGFDAPQGGPYARQPSGSSGSGYGRNAGPASVQRPGAEALGCSPSFSASDEGLNRSPSFSSSDERLNRGPSFSSSDEQLNRSPSFSASDERLNRSPSFSSSDERLERSPSFSSSAEPPFSSRSSLSPSPSSRRLVRSASSDRVGVDVPDAGSLAAQPFWLQALVRLLPFLRSWGGFY